MRIAVVTPCGESGDGECARVVGAQARELERLGHDIEVVSAANLSGAGACDVAHVHLGPPGPGEPPAGIVRTLAERVPVVVTVHDVRGLATRAEAIAAAALVAPSRSHSRAVERSLGLAPGRIHVIPHGICRSLPRSAPAAPAPRAGAPLVVAHFGTPSAAQGTLDLMCSLSLLPPESVELRLGGLATEPEVDLHWTAAARRGLRVRRVESNEALALTEIVDGAHVFALPSRPGQGYGLAVDEALALGLPAWVSAGGGPAERLVAWGRPGRVLPARSPLAWAEAFCAVILAPHLLVEQRARIPDGLPDAGDAARVLDHVITSAAGRSAA